MEPGRPPYLACPRPALELLQAVREAPDAFGFAWASERTRLPRTTLTRHLGDLVEHGLLARLRRDVYAAPAPATLALLLVEPDAYARSLLLHDDVLARRSEGPWAFACLPVRRALPVEIPTVVPVLRLQEAAREEGLRSPLFLYHDFDAAEVERAPRRFPTDAADAPAAVERTFPVLSARTCLALLATTGDPRMLEAVAAAGRKLGVPPAEVARAAKRLHLARGAAGADFPNTVVLPRWLQAMAETAQALQARKALGSALAGDDRGRPA